MISVVVGEYGTGQLEVEYIYVVAFAWRPGPPLVDQRTTLPDTQPSPHVEPAVTASAESSAMLTTRTSRP